MIVKIIEDCTYRGQELKKGIEIAVSREAAIELCEDGFAVASIDLPCEDRQKKAARERSKKKKNKKTTEKDSEV